MGAHLAIAPPLEWAGTLAAALAAAGALVLPGARPRALAMLAALVLAPSVVAGAFAGELSGALPGGAAGIAAAAAVTAAAVAAIAWLLYRRPEAIVVLAVAALPFRVPLDVGGQSANLLLPLYAVVAGGCLAFAWRRLRSAPAAAATDGASPLPAAPGSDRRTRLLELALAAAIVVYALQSLYSSDFEPALKNVAFFYVPFALLMRLLLDVRISRATLAKALVTAVGLALLFAAIGFVEYATRDLLLNPKLVAENQFESYFRVNSLFFDPSIYGRFLAVVMVLLAGLLLWTRSRRHALAGTGALAVLWAGLVLSLSQSSFVALLAGLCVIGALRWRPGRALAGAAAGIALVAVAGVLLFPGAFGVDLRGEGSLDRATSGRFDLMAGGIAMFADRPLQGFGAGSFEKRFRDRENATSAQGAAASHTTPITVAAEQGVIGLSAYLAVLAAGFWLLLAGLGGLRGERSPPALAARATLAAAFSALVVHTLLYAAFLEDPLTWVLLGVAAGLPATIVSSAGPPSAQVSEGGGAARAPRTGTPSGSP